MLNTEIWCELLLKRIDYQRDLETSINIKMSLQNAKKKFSTFGLLQGVNGEFD